MNPYIGQELQLGGVQEVQLLEGKGKGMRLFLIRNEAGLEMSVSPDRNSDISRLSYRGMNLSYFSPCGYVAPAYYDSTGSNWLHSFTAGFLTTCGLNAVGSPCEDEGELLPLHGTIANTPSSHSFWDANEESYLIHSVTRDEAIFGRKLRLSRTITIPKKAASFILEDAVENTGDRDEPFEILYHMNMGYPLLDENSIVTIPSSSVRARDAHAQEDIENWMHMEKPQAGYQERCYYHTFEDGKGYASIYQPMSQVGLSISFDAQRLDGFVEWKMMGIRDYVLGLECGNCLPDGRDVMRKNGMLKFLKPGEKALCRVKVDIITKS